MDNKEYSSSYSLDTKVPGHLFLWNTFEVRNPTPHSGSLTLINNKSPLVLPIDMSKFFPED
jgi:hypothetical protein